MAMGSSGSGAVDCGVGPIVWVRRRNGSWWPGKIMSPEELAECNLSSPRTGTPVKLLGREDASVYVFLHMLAIDPFLGVVFFFSASSFTYLCFSGSLLSLHHLSKHFAFWLEKYLIFWCLRGCLCICITYSITCSQVSPKPLLALITKMFILFFHPLGKSYMAIDGFCFCKCRRVIGHLTIALLSF